MLPTNALGETRLYETEEQPWVPWVIWATSCLPVSESLLVKIESQAKPTQPFSTTATRRNMLGRIVSGTKVKVMSEQRHGRCRD